MSPLKKTICLFLFAAAISACHHDDVTGVGTLVLLDEASDEAWLNFKDAVDQGRTTTDDTKGAKLSDPAPGAALPAATPATFRWTAPAPAIINQHGIETGRFYWLELTGAGLAEPVNLVALVSTSWTPDAAAWAEITKATGTITAKMYTATLDDGLVTQGPYQATGNGTTFTLTR